MVVWVLFLSRLHPSPVARASNHLKVYRNRKMHYSVEVVCVHNCTTVVMTPPQVSRSHASGTSHPQLP